MNSHFTLFSHFTVNQFIQFLYMTPKSDARAARIAALLHGTSLEVRPSARCGGEEGLFSTEAVEEGMVLLTDYALCWLPVEEGAPQSLVADASRSNCEQCGAFIGSPAAILQKLAGDAEPLKLPRLGGAATPKKHVCPRPAPENPHVGQCRVEPDDASGHPVARDGFEQVQMAAQLLARMARKRFVEALEATRAGEKATPDADSPSLAILDALASPTWDVVCRSDGDATEAAGALPRNSLPAVQHALRNRASISLQDAWSDELTAQLYSRALGCVARNSLWVQIPNAAVFYLSAFDEALASGDKMCKRALPAVCALVERILKRRAERGLERRPAPRPAERAGEEGEESAQVDAEEEEEEEEEAVRDRATPASLRHDDRNGY